MLSALVLATSLLGGVPPRDSAADAVTLRDGTVVLGQIVEPAPRGRVSVVLRRSWAEARISHRARRWEQAQSAVSQRTVAQRRERLLAWKRERAAAANDPIASWLVGAVKRLDEAPFAAPLIQVELDRAEVRSVVRRPPDIARMLRQAWRGGIADAETRPVAELKEALEGRGFALSEIDPAPIDGLLPLPVESESRWLSRRAATEVGGEPGLRLIRYGGLVIPEGTNAGGGGADLTGAAVAALKSVLGDDSDDPLAAKLRELARRGRVGAVVTRLDMADDLSSVSVESTLWVRTGADMWVPAISRPAKVRCDDVPADEGRPLAADPQVQALFRIVEGIGLGSVPAETKQRSLSVGAATRRALGMAQSALARELDALALPVNEQAAAGRDGP
jgi:hypothetical protein